MSATSSYSRSVDQKSVLNFSHGKGVLVIGIANSSPEPVNFDKVPRRHFFSAVGDKGYFLLLSNTARGP